MTTRDEWLEHYAEALGVTAPTPEEIDQLLELAGHAAHASERTAAPISCFLAARSDRPLLEALGEAARLAAEIDAPPSGGR